MVIAMVEKKEVKKAVEKKPAVKKEEPKKEEHKVEKKPEVKHVAKVEDKKEEKKKEEPKETKKPVAREPIKVERKEFKKIVPEKKQEPVQEKKVEHKEVKPEIKAEVKAVVKPEHKEVRRTKSKPKIKLVLVKAKRKTAIARAVIKEGKGRVTINKVPYTEIGNRYLVHQLEEPILLSQQKSKDLASKVDIEINVQGGGQVSRVIAARGCIAKGLVKYYDDNDLKAIYFSYDRTLLVDDIRRKEKKKQLGRGARAKWQHSKR